MFFFALLFTLFADLAAALDFVQESTITLLASTSCPSSCEYEYIHNTSSNYADETISIVSGQIIAIQTVVTPNCYNRHNSSRVVPAPRALETIIAVERPVIKSLSNANDFIYAGSDLLCSNYGMFCSTAKKFNHTVVHYITPSAKLLALEIKTPVLFSTLASPLKLASSILAFISNLVSTLGLNSKIVLFISALFTAFFSYLGFQNCSSVFARTTEKVSELNCQIPSPYDKTCTDFVFYNTCTNLVVYNSSTDLTLYTNPIRLCNFSILKVESHTEHSSPGAHRTTSASSGVYEVLGSITHCSNSDLESPILLSCPKSRSTSTSSPDQPPVTEVDSEADETSGNTSESTDEMIPQKNFDIEVLEVNTTEAETPELEPRNETTTTDIEASVAEVSIVQGTNETASELSIKKQYPVRPMEGTNFKLERLLTKQRRPRRLPFNYYNDLERNLDIAATGIYSLTLGNDFAHLGKERVFGTSGDDVDILATHVRDVYHDTLLKLTMDERRTEDLRATTMNILDKMESIRVCLNFEFFIEKYSPCKLMTRVENANSDPKEWLEIYWNIFMSWVDMSNQNARYS